MNIKNLFLGTIIGLSATASIFPNPAQVNAQQQTEATTWQKIKSGSCSAFVGGTTGLLSGYATKVAIDLLKIREPNPQTGTVFTILFLALMGQEYKWRTKFMDRITKKFDNASDKELMTDIATLASWACFLSPTIHPLVSK